MQLGHLARSNGPRLFASDGDRWIIVSEALEGGPETLDELVRSGKNWLDDIDDALASPSAQLGPHGEKLATPFVAPPAIVAIGLNYSDHCREFGVPEPTAPVVFTKLPVSVAADGDDIIWSSSITNQVDWEVELAVVIGKRTRNVGVEDALDSVFGYTIVNDVTGRDIQSTEQQWTRAKSLDTFCPIGPVVIPARDISDPQDLAIKSRLNGVTMQDSNTSEMIFSVAELISRLSATFTLSPGDIIATGTPLGVGAFRSPPVFLKKGDVIEVEIEKIGTLSNTCHPTKKEN